MRVCIVEHRHNIIFTVNSLSHTHTHKHIHHTWTDADKNRNKNREPTVWMCEWANEPSQEDKGLSYTLRLMTIVSLMIAVHHERSFPAFDSAIIFAI